MNQNTKARRNYKYAPVSTVDNDDDDEGLVLPPRAMGHNPRARQIGGEISNYVHSIFWICLALFVVKYTDLIRVIRLDDRVILPLVYIAGVSWCGVLALIIYLSFYLPCCKKLRVDDFNVTHPQHIQATLFLTVVSYISFVAAIWSIWGWLSLLIVGSVLMGLVMIPNFIPNY
eukprot:CAMPEP_0197040170 /NCGR_PEP_ID=MMETSP1384-20130603/16917_1 /TAXON_ID=29189 /ORGANISM="Ammonia sp." /LENGTH=172 /DNA_ID=CAMNT_0042470883 /DNA_START=74 /DNA_END=592 /DNA_ORIENTATION=-